MIRECMSFNWKLSALICSESARIGRRFTNSGSEQLLESACRELPLEIPPGRKFMARNTRDGLPWSNDLELWSPIVPDFREKSPRRLPPWIQFPAPGKSDSFGNPPQQSLPKLPDIKVWDRLIREMPDTAPPRPHWIRPLPFAPRPDPSPFPDPPLAPRQTPPAHEVDPPEHRGSVVTEMQSEPVGGLLSLLQEAMRQSEPLPGAGPESRLQNAPAQTVPIRATQPVRRLVRMKISNDSR